MRIKFLAFSGDNKCFHKQFLVWIFILKDKSLQISAYLGVVLSWYWGINLWSYIIYSHIDIDVSFIRQWNSFSLPQKIERVTTSYFHQKQYKNLRDCASICLLYMSSGILNSNRRIVRPLYRWEEQQIW